MKRHSKKQIKLSNVNWQVIRFRFNGSAAQHNSNSDCKNVRNT